MKLVWLIVAILFGIGELLTPTLTLVWFSIGAVILIFLSSFVDSILVQLLIFAIISISMLFIATKKIIKKDEGYQYETNLQGVISKGGVVKEDIFPNKLGIVAVEAQEWSAISFDNSIIEKGSKVEILKIEGVKLVVKKIN
ncbi:MAG: NfeD family protein [Romboutsia sp.]